MSTLLTCKQCMCGFERDDSNYRLYCSNTCKNKYEINERNVRWITRKKRRTVHGRGALVSGAKTYNFFNAWDRHKNATKEA